MDRKKMVDDLGRTINEGDIVVVRAGGRKVMLVGVRVGNSIRTIEGISQSSAKFLVVNPTKEELDIKNTILSKISSKKSSTVKPKKADVPGCIYLMSRHEAAYVYLGKVTVEHYMDGVLKTTKRGHVYLLLSYRVYDPSIYSSLTMDGIKNTLIARGYLGTHDEEQFGTAIEVTTAGKVCKKEIGSISDFTPNFEIEYGGTIYINGFRVYEKGKYKFYK